MAELHQRAEDWVQVVAWVALGVGFASALIVLADIFRRGYRQQMGIMDAVYPITGLYWGPVTLWFYFRRGRKKSPKWQEEHPGDEEDLGREVFGAPWWATSKAVAHCGAGCTLGDIVGEWLVWLLGWSIPVFGYFAANEFVPVVIVDFVLAWTFGIVFQYFTIVPMREGVSGLQGVWAAIKADTLSIVAFQVGLFGWMALYHLVLWKPPLMLDSPEYWFMMQVGMIVGYFTAWPVNALLIRAGIKEKM
jgi:hypothetical protein